MKPIVENILNFIYPRCCPVCHKILADQSALVCGECVKSLIPIQEPFCKLCGKPVGQEEEYCRDCRGKTHVFDQGRGIFLYDARMKESILRYKYGGRRQYGDFYARSMCIYGEREVKRWKPDLIVPIPLYRRKQRKRGFNQAEYLAAKVGDYFGIPVDSSILKKTRDTKSQKKMDAGRRRVNLLGAFRAMKPVKGKRVMVVDDVYTTGSTMDAAARCLKDAGACSVCFLTVCIGMEKDK